ncbi:MAG: [Fe-Fe] hydrogenase large subunit C-terminal domain-containing protein [Clostridia bacterium]
MQITDKKLAIKNKLIRTKALIKKRRETPRVQVDKKNACIERDESRCVRCGLCYDACEKQTGLASKNKCVGCGYCTLACKANALTPKDSVFEVKKLIGKKILVASISPAVKFLFADAFGGKVGQFSQSETISVLKNLGFNYVLDTSFGADLTIREETAELCEKMQNKNDSNFMPIFSSCCTAWVEYFKIMHPDQIMCLSSCKSPIGMLCAITKTYFARKIGVDPSKIVFVAITPCTAKKQEIKTMCEPKFDFVLTVRELCDFAKKQAINFDMLKKDCEFDFVQGSKLGIGFGGAGGVMKSIAQNYCKINKIKDELIYKKIDKIPETQIVNVKTKTFASVCGFKNFEKLYKKILNKSIKLDFLEVMACKGGCLGGGGQSTAYCNNVSTIKKRIDAMGAKCAILKEPNLKEVGMIDLETEFLGRPLSAKSKEILHNK